MLEANRLVAADVHAASSYLAGVELASGELWRRRVSGPPSRVVEVLAGLDGAARLVYEAGPTGFGLARAAAAAGIAVGVCAPGSIPRAPGDRVKTDKRDAERLLRLWRAGELTFVRVPSPAEEGFRDLVRAREDARGDLMRHRHRLSKFLLRREILAPEHLTGGAWSIPWMTWVTRLRLDDLAAQATLVDYVAAVQAAIARREALEAAIEAGWVDCPWATEIARLRCFRGINTLTAAGLCAEIGDFRRFRRPDQLAGFIGLVPSERSSGTKRRQGAITKAGSGHARRLLVEAAHHYRHRPAVRYELQRRQRGQDPRAITVAWRAQQRLHRRFEHLAFVRRKPAGVTTVAVARELVAFCWEAATLT